jgi:hypothetical protein
MQIGRRSAKIQKDFFSASEYLVYGTNQVLEMNYYKKRRQKKNSILDAFIFE